MINTSQIIPEIIQAGRKPDKNYPQRLVSETADLFDLINYRIANKSVEEVAESLVPKFFKLSILSIEMTRDDNTSQNSGKSVPPYTYSNAQLESPLYKTIQEVEEVQEIILSQVNTDLDKIVLPDLKYKTLQIFSHFPDKRVNYIKLWIDESMKCTLGKIIAQLILFEQIQFEPSRIDDELIPFLRKTVIRLGAYSIFTNFWHPREDTEYNVLINSMEILASTIEMKYFPPKNVMSLSEVKALLTE